MADKSISQLAAASTPLAGTEVLPIVQSSTTVKVATDNLTVKNIRSNATTGILQVVGPAAAATRTMTVPDANFTAARTDAAQTFTGSQVFTSAIQAGSSPKSLTTVAGNATSAAVRTILYKTVFPAAAATIDIDIPLSDFDYTFTNRLFRTFNTMFYFLGTRDTGLNFQPTACGVIAVAQSAGAFISATSIDGPNLANGGMTGFSIAISISSGNLRFTLSNTFPANFDETTLKFMA